MFFEALKCPETMKQPQNCQLRYKKSWMIDAASFESTLIELQNRSTASSRTWLGFKREFMFHVSKQNDWIFGDPPLEPDTKTRQPPPKIYPTSFVGPTCLQIYAWKLSCHLLCISASVSPSMPQSQARFSFQHRVSDIHSAFWSLNTTKLLHSAIIGLFNILFL